MVNLEDFMQQWAGHFGEADRVAVRYPFRGSRYFCNLIRSPGDPIWKQVIPDLAELTDASGWEDPLGEEKLSPVPNLVHRYPNRVLWLVSSECATHCRFCTRKRRWNNPTPLDDGAFKDALDYIRLHREIRDVLLSGGDPLMLPTNRLQAILLALKEIPHIDLIRIGTRIPGVQPKRVTRELAATLAQYHPLFINIHFNHPMEITPQSRQACAILADAGIPLGSQTVLLRGVNDEASTLAELFQRLLTLRVRPYYLLQMDLTQSTGHFRTPLSAGLKILGKLRNRISGLAMPQFVVDLPGGHGKIPIVEDRIEEIGSERLIFRDYTGRQCEYPLLPGESDEITTLLKHGPY